MPFLWGYKHIFDIQNSGTIKDFDGNLYDIGRYNYGPSKNQKYGPNWPATVADRNDEKQTRVAITDAELKRGVCMGVQNFPGSTYLGGKTSVKGTCSTTWRYRYAESAGRLEYGDHNGDFQCWDVRCGSLNKISDTRPYTGNYRLDRPVFNRRPKTQVATCPKGYKATRCTCMGEG